MIEVHPLAIVDKKAELSEGVKVGPFTYIGPNVFIGENTEIGTNVHIERNTRIGKNCKLYHGAAIGLPPQDVNYKGEESFVEIGDNNIIREFVTIHRATGEGKVTRIGSNNFLMAYSHIAHNCRIGSNVIIVNAVQLAGFVDVDDFSFISGLSGFHQYTRIGKYAIVGGASRITQDVVPYIMVVGNPARVVGLNMVGLKRRGFSRERIDAIKDAFKVLFRSNLNTSQALKILKNHYSGNPDIEYLVEFIESSKRGILKKMGEATE